MYSRFKEKITSGTDAYPLNQILFENGLFIINWFLTAYLLWPIWAPFSALIWIALLLYFQIMLKKHNCSGCYYYGKSCHLGWGRWAKALFAQDSGCEKTGEKMTLFYIISPLLTVIVSSLYLILNRAFGIYLGAFILFLIVNALSFSIRKKGCAVCRMRDVCPGSAVSQEG